jgi:hypothetical protein
MSVETYGAQECRVYFVQESVYGQIPTNPTMLGINTEGPDPKINPSLIEVMGVGSKDLQALYVGMRKVNLKIPYLPGQIAPTSLIQHVQTLSSLSVLVAYYKGLWTSPSNIIAFLHTGCKIDKLTVESKVDDIVKADVELIGQNVARSTSLPSGATFGDYPGGIPFYLAKVQKGAAGGGSLTDLTDVTDWKFEIQNNLKEVPIIQSLPSGATATLLKYLRERNRKLSGELTLEFESDWALADVLNDTQFSLNFQLGSGHAALFTYCKWEEFNPTTKIKDLVSVKLKFLAQNVAIT